MTSRIAVITFLEPGDPNYPSQGLPGVPGIPSQGLPWAPVRPDQGLPWGPGHPSGGFPISPVRPDNGLPVGPPGSIGTLPVFPFDPSVPVGPGSGGGETPDQGLPGQGGVATPPIVTVRPGLKLVVKYLCGYGFILVPDNTLPTTPGTPDNTLPGAAPKTK